MFLFVHEPQVEKLENFLMFSGIQLSSCHLNPGLRRHKIRCRQMWKSSPALAPVSVLPLPFNKEPCLAGKGCLAFWDRDYNMELYLAEIWAVVFLLNTWRLRKVQCRRKRGEINNSRQTILMRKHIPCLH